MDFTALQTAGFSGHLIKIHHNKIFSGSLGHLIISQHNTIVFPVLFSANSGGNAWFMYAGYRPSWPLTLRAT